MKITQGRVSVSATVVYEHKDHSAVRGNVTSRAWFWPARIEATFHQQPVGWTTHHVRVMGPNCQGWAKTDGPRPQVEARWTERPQEHPNYHLSHAPAWVQQFVKTHKPGGTA